MPLHPIQELESSSRPFVTWMLQHGLPTLCRRLAIDVAADAFATLDESTQSRLGHIHALIDRLGDDPGLWYANWRQAATASREVVNALTEIPLQVKSPSDFEERHGQHGLRFAGGRSLQVTPHSSVAVGQLKVPPIGAAVASAREAALALESGIRMLFLTEAAVYLVHEVLHVLDSIGLGRHEVIIVGRMQAADVKGVAASSVRSPQRWKKSEKFNRNTVRCREEHWQVMSHLDAAALAFQEKSPEDDVEVWQQFEASMRGAVSAVGVSEMPPERLKTFLLRGSRP
ncbi:Smok2b, partial [Symbiodinium microadriaticum]